VTGTAERYTKPEDIDNLIRKESMIITDILIIHKKNDTKRDSYNGSVPFLGRKTY
jgi:hypothetical protein